MEPRPSLAIELNKLLIDFVHNAISLMLRNKQMNVMWRVIIDRQNKHLECIANRIWIRHFHEVHFEEIQFVSVLIKEWRRQDDFLKMKSFVGFESCNYFLFVQLRSLRLSVRSTFANLEGFHCVHYLHLDKKNKMSY